MHTINRREFLGTSSIAGAAVSCAARAQNSGPKLKLGLIGCGGYGGVDLRAAFQAGGVEVVALCDVDSQHLEATAQEVVKLQGARPKTYADYRRLLDQPDLQAVIIATPPQWHALPFIAACRKGLDIYCEKPLAYDIREGRAMVNAARQARRVVQVGFQRRQSLAVQQAAQYLQSGQAGRIVQVDVQIHYAAKLRDTTVQDPPSSLDWDFWCGPAPKLLYSPNIGHFAWRLEAAYGNGHLVDWGIHWIDAVRRILGEKTPRTVQAMGGLYYLKDRITTPDTLTVHFDFPTCPVTWRHRIWGATEYNPEVSNGMFFYGERETVFVADDRWIVIPREKEGDKRVDAVKTPDMATLHMADFLQAVRTRRSPLCDVEDGFHSTATVQLGMIAYHAGCRIEWDAAAESISGNPAATRLLKREYRPPWKHPADELTT